MTDRKDGQLTKRVEFTAKDADEQIATGVVMVPDAVDRQRDFVRPATIEDFADQFGNLYEAGEASGGVMHAVFPEDHVDLERNDVLDEAAEIGGSSVEAGAWVQSWRFEDEQLWGLVDEGVLEGYSIGAIDVTWGGPYAQEDLDEAIRVPDEINEDEPVWELMDGLVREVSSVDIPAVPDAQILETKADAEKRLSDHLGNRDGFIDEAIERGHSEEEAEQLWEYLNRAVDIEGAGDPGKQSVFARAGKAFLSAFTGADDDGTAKTSEDPDATAAKEGRTLSTANRNSLFATVDATLDVLEDGGVEHDMTRFTDRDEYDFDLSDHQARTWSSETDSDPEHDPGNVTPDDDKHMTDTDTDIEEKFEALEKRLDEIEEQTKADDPDADADKGDDGLEGKIDALEEKLDAVAEASGKSQQLEGDSSERQTTSKADILGLPGGDN